MCVVGCVFVLESRLAHIGIKRTERGPRVLKSQLVVEKRDLLTWLT